MWSADKWEQYRLIDSADGEKLEYWGDYLLRRPDPQAVCGCFDFYSRADRSASYPDCNGTYEEQKTEKYVGRTDGGKTAFG